MRRAEWITVGRRRRYRDGGSDRNQQKALIPTAGWGLLAYHIMITGDVCADDVLECGVDSAVDTPDGT